MDAKKAQFADEAKMRPVLADFRKRITDAGYTKAGLLELMSRYIDSDRRLDLDAIRIVARGDNPLHALCRLFITGETAAPAELERLLPEDLLRSLVEIGFLLPEGAGLRSAGQLTPIEEMLVLSDFGPEVTSRPFPEDFVLGVGTASLNLAGLTVRRKAATALDLGAGGGIQALFCARHVERITCTDTNARALGFARFNFALNGVVKAELKHGSLFEPVEGGTFDLIVSNPPFVISPEEAHGFRSATGMRGDSVSQAVVEGAGPRLEPGGFAAILLNWGHENDDDWHAKPLLWCAEAGCGRWLLCFDTEEPSVYARRWLKDGNRHLRGAEFAGEMEKWLSYYAELGFKRISAGALILHKPERGATWSRRERISRNVLAQGECGDQIERICRSETILATAADDAALLDRKLALSPDHKLVHSMRLKDGRWSLLTSTLLNAKGFEMAGSMDIASMALLERCDGSVTLRTALSLAAAAIGEDSKALEAGAVSAAKNLMRKGHLFAVEA